MKMLLPQILTVKTQHAWQLQLASPSCQNHKAGRSHRACIFKDAPHPCMLRHLGLAVAGHQLRALTARPCATDRILVPVADKHTDRLAAYREPTPEVVGDLRELIGRTPMQKFILAGDEQRIEEARPLFMELLADRVELTTALPGFLEVALPPRLPVLRSSAQLSSNTMSGPVLHGRHH